MDPEGTRRVSGILAAVSVAMIAVGALLYLVGHPVPGIILAVVFVAVLVICLGIRSFLNAFAFNQMVRGAGKR